MNIKPFRNEAELTAALARLEELWGAPIDSPEGHELEVLAAQIEKYEDEHYPMPASNPANAIEFLRDQQRH
jgi:HTH-type transcriptional regulator/antitoxin HigA